MLRRGSRRGGVKMSVSDMLACVAVVVQAEYAVFRAILCG